MSNKLKEMSKGDSKKMLSINPDLIDITTDGKLVQDPESETGLAVQTSYRMTVPEQGGVAYIRITPQLRDFFKLCQEKHGVIGFEYDFEEADLNFGLVLKKGSEDEKA
jgi:hypothetical protein